MGIVVDPGERFEQTCKACGERLILIGTGFDIAACPYCKATLMDDLVFSVDECLEMVEGSLRNYKADPNPDTKLKLGLALGDFYDALSLEGKFNHRLIKDLRKQGLSYKYTRTTTFCILIYLTK